jgi:hypothetical protein
MLEARHFIIFTDHKPITCTFQQKRDKCSPRQFNHLDFIAQFMTDIRHISGQDNVVATFFKADLQASVAEPIAHPVEPAYLITQLHQHKAHLRPVPPTLYTNPGTFIHKDLTNCTHVFLREDSTRRVLEPPYSGPYQLLTRKDKTLKLLEDDSGHTISKPAATATPTTAPSDIPTLPSTTKTTCSGRHVHFSVRFTS